MSSKVRRVLAIGMLVLLIIVSAVSFYSRENRVFYAATTVSAAPDMSPLLRWRRAATTRDSRNHQES